MALEWDLQWWVVAAGGPTFVIPLLGVVAEQLPISLRFFVLRFWELLPKFVRRFFLEIHAWRTPNVSTDTVVLHFIFEAIPQRRSHKAKQILHVLLL